MYFIVALYKRTHTCFHLKLTTYDILPTFHYLIFWIYYENNERIFTEAEQFLLHVSSENKRKIYWCLCDFSHESHYPGANCVKCINRPKRRVLKSHTDRKLTTLVIMPCMALLQQNFRKRPIKKSLPVCM